MASFNGKCACPAPTFAGEPGTGVIDEDLAHQAGGEAAKVPAAVIVRWALADESGVGLVDESCGFAMNGWTDRASDNHLPVF